MEHISSANVGRTLPGISTNPIHDFQIVGFYKQCVCLQVADLIKQDRLNRLNAVINEVAEERAQRFRDKTVEVKLTALAFVYVTETQQCGPVIGAQLWARCLTV